MNWPTVRLPSTVTGSLVIRSRTRSPSRAASVAMYRASAVAGAGEAGERDQHEDAAETERHERSCDGDPKLGPGAREPALELRHAAEQPERNPVDLQPFSPRLPGMTELVQEDRDEEQDSRDDRHREMRAAGEARVLGRKDSVGERPDDQCEDHEPAPADPHLDAADAAERDIAVHRIVRANKLMPGQVRM